MSERKEAKIHVQRIYIFGFYGTCLINEHS